MLQSRATVRVLLTAGLAGLLALGAAGCQDDTAGGEQDVAVEDVQGPERAGDDAFGVGEAGDLNTFYENLDQYVGQQVTVSAQVTEEGTQYRNAFKLTGDDVGGDPLLVIEAAGSEPRVREGQVVRVTGVVREVPEAGEQQAFEEQAGRDLDVSFYEENQGRKAITAESVEVIEGADPDVEQETAAGREG